jgi:hypothetical protein
MKSELLTSAPSPVSDTLILICEKCGKKLLPEAVDNPSRTLQLGLKEKIKTGGLKGVFRAVITSCMDICPENEIAIGVVRPSVPETQFYTLNGSLVKDSGVTPEIIDSVFSIVSLAKNRI